MFSLWALLWDPYLEPDVPPTTDRKVLVDHYFRPTPMPSDKRPARMAGLAAMLLLLFGVIITFFNVLLGGALLVASLLLWANGVSMKGDYEGAYRNAQPKPTDQEMDDWLRQDCQTAANKAMKRMNVTSRQVWLTIAEAFERHPAPGDPPLWDAEHYDSPPTVHGPALNGKNKNARVGDDGIWRFRANEVLVICPTRHHLGIYECTIDMHTGKPGKQELREVYYADVSMVSMVDKSVEINLISRNSDGSIDTAFGGKVDLRELQIAFPSGDRSEIVAAIHESNHQRRVPLQRSDFDVVIAALRGLLRERKQPLSVL